MRSTLVAVAFVAGAIAVPFQKRDVVTDIDMVYVTDVVTVTATGEEPAATASSSEAQSTSVSIAQAPAHYGHHSYHWSAASEADHTSTSEYVAPVASSTSQYVAPVTSSSSQYVAPPPTSTYVAPSPTSTYVAPPPSSTYVAPASTSTSVYVAPTSTSQYVAPSSTYVAPTTSAAPVSSAAAAPTSYQDIAVYHHNLHRANHSAPDIEWDAGLASTAATIASSCVYAHDTTTNGGGYGQNIAAGVESANISAIITDMFYNGEVNWFDGLYGAANPDMTNFEHWGHFSQIVWKASTKLGCATQHCPNGLANTGSDVSPYFTVCNYASPGNFGGEYGDNIGASLNKPTVDWNAGGIS